MKRTCIYVLGGTMGLLLGVGSSMALTVEQLHSLIGQREKLTIIDVRSKRDYLQSHILGAINIPAQVCAAKPLPPLGRVIVYGDGLNPDLTPIALEALKAKPGIYPEPLEGGFQRWEALNYPTTRQHGMEKENLRHVSYQELQQIVATNPDLVLVDLRRSNPAENELTALTTAFAGIPTVSLEQIRGEVFGHNKLYVLIDGGDGTADVVARRLKEAGIKRLAILAGGELILRRQGQSGITKQ